jgi:ABC-2 type transport system permease protein
MNVSALRYLGALIAVNLRSVRAQPALTLTAAAMMIGNNLIIFSIWFIYFAKFSNLRGWVLADMGMLIGIVAWGFGLTVALAGGVRDIAQIIVDGRLDVYLGRPRHPLPALLLSRSIPSGFGDMISAFIFWIWIAKCSAVEIIVLLALSTAAGVILCATLAITQCIVFWWPRAHSFCEDLFNMLLMVAFYPQHPYGLIVRILLLTVFPTGLIALVPVEAIREASVPKALAILAAAVIYALLAKWIFDRGVRNYSSGNRMIELR